MTPFVLISGDFVTTGGMDRANYSFASYLARHGHSVALVAHRAAPELLDLPTVRLHRVPKILGSYLLSGPLLDQAGRFWARRLARAGARVVVNGGNCEFGDVNWVHYVHAAFAPSGDGMLAQRLRRQIGHQLFRRAERRALQRARLVIANSMVTRDDLLERVGLDPTRVQVVYYGIDPEVFHPATPAERSSIRVRMGWTLDRPLIAFVGALGDRRKGFDTLFAAWQILCRDRGWDCGMVVMGAGAELPAWKARAALAGLAERICFLGFRQDVPELLRACDALVSPTRYEAYGLNVHEALCCGLPAFVSGNAGVAERYPVPLHDLLLPDPGDVTDLVERLRAWRANPGRHFAALREVSDSWRAYTWEHMAEALRVRIEAA